MGFWNQAYLALGWEITEAQADAVLQRYRSSEYASHSRVKLPGHELGLRLVHTNGSTAHEGFEHFAIALLFTEDPIAVRDLDATPEQLAAAMRLLEEFAPDLAAAAPLVYAWPAME
jgi:hypothetical protein